MAPRIEQEIVIHAPVEYVWRAITEPEQIRLWFSEYTDQHNQGWSTYLGRLREHIGRRSAGL
jgi:uncharacterized protein YndB with AHSA1/START domain